MLNIKGCDFLEDNYILIRKTDSDLVLGLKEEVVKIFSEIFVDCRDNKVFFDDGNYLDYKLSNKDKNLLYLKVTSSLSEMRAAALLDKFCCSFSKGEHRKNYHIVIDYSQSSFTYCCKLMPYFGEFERRIRELVYLTIIKALGEEWFEKSFHQELSDNIKERVGKNKKIIVETALDELTYEQLISYLFVPHEPLDLNDFFDEIKDESFFEKSQKEIYDRIRAIRKISLWERFFSDKKDLVDLNFYIKELQPLRNKVMHHKNVSKKDYDSARDKLKDINQKLELAILDIEDRNFAYFDYNGLTIPFEETLSAIKNAIASLLKPLEDLYADKDNMFGNLFSALGSLAVKYNDVFGIDDETTCEKLDSEDEYTDIIRSDKNDDEEKETGQ